MDPQIGKKYTIEQLLVMGFEPCMSAVYVKTPCLRPRDGRPIERYFVQRSGVYEIIEPVPEKILFL